MSYEFNDKELKKRLEAAQRRLDILVAINSTRYVPIDSGVLRNSVNTLLREKCHGIHLMHITSIWVKI